MTEWTLAIPEELWDRLAPALGESVETAWTLLARAVEDPERPQLLVVDVISVPDEAYKVREARKLDITSDGWMPAGRRAAEQNLVPLFAHTHPGGTPQPSISDDAMEPGLAGALQTRAHGRAGAVILGGTTQAPKISGRIYTADACEPLRRLRIAGRAMQVVLAHGVADEPADEIFNRQVLSFGEQGQAVLRELRVGVVGTGGTGSAVAEQLIRLGIGEIVAIDDDAVDDSNLTRIHESDHSHVGMPKVDVVESAAQRIPTGTRVIKINARVNTRPAVERLATCDVVFGCTDDDLGRSVLSRLPYWCLSSVIDLGVTIDTEAGAIRDIVGRVTVIAPGAICMACRNTFDPQRAAEQAMPAHDRAALAKEGYARGLDERNPAVVSYTTGVASLAVNELKGRLFRYVSPNATELTIKFDQREIRTRAGRQNPGCYCNDRAKWGLGPAEGRPLGLLLR